MAIRDIYVWTISHYLEPIRAFLADTRVTEIMINRIDEIFIERDGKLEKTSAQFADEEVYQAAVNNILQFAGETSRLGLLGEIACLALTSFLVGCKEVKVKAKRKKVVRFLS